MALQWVNSMEAKQENQRFYVCRTDDMKHYYVHTDDLTPSDLDDNFFSTRYEAQEYIEELAAKLAREKDDDYDY